jgi:Fe-S-cluster containining protein
MCGECCKRYMIPVNSSDIRRISAFTSLEPKEFLELIIPNKSVASTYGGVPRISLEGKIDNVLVLKEEDDTCMFLKDRRCAIYRARPLRCRPFPFSYEMKRGKIAFTINEEAAEFCMGLGRETKRVDFTELSSVVLSMEDEQSVFRDRAKEWNSKVFNRSKAKYTMGDLLKFLLPHNKCIQPKLGNLCS